MSNKKLSMGFSRMKPERIYYLVIGISLILLTVSCFYMKMQPPSDVDKAAHNHTGTSTCWLATAANLLAGAGYGNGATLQTRAGDIYKGLVNHFGTGGGWTDTAVSWWLLSSHNTWPGNPYSIVSVYGNKFPKYPWSNPDGARFIGNELRRCQFVGLSISWPTWDSSIGENGHAITAWGDSCSKGSNLSSSPSKVRVCDSDRDINGDVQVYRYDQYTNPNPTGPNEGNGWYIDYSSNHPYIKHIITLCPTDNPADKELTQKVLGCYKIHQANDKIRATDLHYKVGTDTTILSYKTRISWITRNSPTIIESEPERTELTVDWNLNDNPIPYCTDVYICTEFILPRYNKIYYRDVFFTYPESGILEKFPQISWTMDTPRLENERPELIPNVTGGYVVGGFDIVRVETHTNNKNVAEYRFIHEYSYDQNPELHTLTIEGPEDYHVTNLRFGHSYGFPDITSLWKFEKWMTQFPRQLHSLKEKIQLKIDWKGRLPYPEGETFKGKIPTEEKKTIADRRG